MEKTAKKHLIKHRPAGYHKDMDHQDSVTFPSRLPLSKGKILIILALAITAGIFLVTYFLYQRYFLPFQTLTKLNYDSGQATRLLNNPESFAFTQEGSLLIGVPTGNKIQLATSDTLGQKIVSLKISKSRNYLTWQSEKGILGLDVEKKNIFLIYPGKPKQSYDLSPLEDHILFLTDKELLNVNLTNSFVNKRLSLPRLSNPNLQLNHIKYSPDGNQAYLRSISNNDPQGKKEFLVNLKQNKYSEFPDSFTEPLGLAPLWTKDSDSLISTRESDLVVYNLSNQEVRSLNFKEKSTDIFGSYGLYPQEGLIVFLALQDTLKFNNRTRYTNPKVILTDLDRSFKQVIIDSITLSSDQGNDSNISDVGWINRDNIWFIVTTDQNSSRDLWIINKNGKNPQKIIPGIDQFSLESSKMPLYNIII